MPASIVNLQKRFKLVLKDDIPIALVENDDDGSWVRCCPLCGCIHKIQDDASVTAYRPLCQTLSSLFKSHSLAWRKRYPDIAGYATLNLVYHTT
jgi:hypothetical protein